MTKKTLTVSSLSNFHKRILDYIKKNNSDVKYFNFVDSLVSSVTSYNIKSHNVEFFIKKFELLYQESQKLINSEYENSLLLVLKEKIRKQFIKSDIVIPSDYKNKYSIEYAAIDIEHILLAIKSENSIFKIIALGNKKYSFKVYSYNDRSLLSRIVPILVSFGFNVLNDTSYDFASKKNIIHLSVFELSINHLETEISDNFISNIENVFKEIYYSNKSIDNLYQLIILLNLNCQEVTLLDSFAGYMKQVYINYSLEEIKKVLLKHYKVVKLLLELFAIRLKYKVISKRKLNCIYKKLEDYLNIVKIRCEDLILRKIIDIINSITHTNYFNRKTNDYIVFKVDNNLSTSTSSSSARFEIYVYSHHFEGVHLRHKEISRGGIRLSDRLNDYRIEILGLMKTQIAKNSIIIPSGGKGGFVIKSDFSNRDNNVQEDFIVNCYKNYLQGLLDVTPNISNMKNVNDKGYLVVAADKGTSNFSNYANNIAKQYNFWLGDAFASGGMTGYNHKKIGITAKGAWISAELHCQNIGVNISKDIVTIVGIGDMSGDVFGNAMILAKKVKLVAAFNHSYIFIDPNPDVKTSWEERKRLFHLSKSDWNDYNPSILSKGGAVFSRATKSIKLNKIIRNVFNIKSENIIPDDLIKAILLHKVDLIWNGGIGTYIKSSKEFNSDISDKINDVVRVDAKNLKAKMIIEGGNLGVSPLGRVEFNKKGGIINADFIDNVSGVICSDLEVNIKLILDICVNKKKITSDIRNDLLHQMNNSVVDKVLLLDRKQKNAINIFEKASLFTNSILNELVNFLEKEPSFHDVTKYLPSAYNYQGLRLEIEKITRPELCLLLSYSKIAIYNILSKSDLCKDKFLIKYLHNYFPSEIVSRFKDLLILHPLKNEIINTVIANDIVNHLNGAIINIIQVNTDASINLIAKYYVVIVEIFDINNLWEQLMMYDSKISISLYEEINKLLRRGIVWFINNYNKDEFDITTLINKYKSVLQNFLLDNLDMLHSSFNSRYKVIYNKYRNANIQHDIANKIAKFSDAVSILDIEFISQKTSKKLDVINEIYFFMGQALKLNFLRNISNHLESNSYWDYLSIQSIKDDIYELQKLYIYSFIKYYKNNNLNKNGLQDWLNNNSHLLKSYFEIINLLQDTKNISINLIILAIKKLKTSLSIINNN